MAFAGDELFNGQEWTRTYDNLSDSYDFSIPVKSIYFFDTPEALLCKWHEIDDNPNGPEGMWYWVCETGDDGSPCTVCSGAFDPDDIDEIFVELMWR